MKNFKISFILSLFLLCSLQGRSAAVIHAINDNEYDIEQSPLSDDETNPISSNTAELATFDFEDNDENHSDLTNTKTVSFVSSKTHFPTFISLAATKAYEKDFHFSVSDSPQSFLQVFRI